MHVVFRLTEQLKRIPPRFRRGGIIFALAGILSACGLSNEPGILRTAELPTATPIAPAPIEPANLARGRALFLSDQGCQTCHGTTGKGDGPVMASMQCDTPPHLADPESSRGKTPLAWFLITSNGNNSNACRMPPWRRVLTDQQRWDVVAYAYSLQYTPAQLAQGKQVWGQQCAACHGDSAAGDGPQAKTSPRPVPNLSGAAPLTTRSDTMLYASITDGIPDMGQGSHSFKTALSAADRWAAVAYLRSLGWIGVDQIGLPITTPTATPDTSKITPTATPILPTIPPDTPLTVTGKITSGTLGVKVSEGQTLTLRLVQRTASGMQDAARYDTKSAADGAFSFTNIPRRADVFYVVFTIYDGLPQFSDQVQIKPETPATLDLSVRVYNVTHDPSVVRIDVYQMLIDFTSAETAQIQQGMRLINTSDRIFVSDQKTADGQEYSVEIDLPHNAQRISLPSDNSLQAFTLGPNSSAPTALGLFAMTPGDPVLFQASYALPYSGILQFNVYNRFPISAVVLALPADKARFGDSRFNFEQNINLQSGSYDEYVMNQSLFAGDGLQFAVGTVADAENASRLGVLMLAGVVLLAIGGTVFVIARLNRRDARKAPTAPSQSESLVKAIAALDAEFEAGKIEMAEYQTRRAVLKDQLVEALNSPPSQKGS